MFRFEGTKMKRPRIPPEVRQPALLGCVTGCISTRISPFSRKNVQNLRKSVQNFVFRLKWGHQFCGGVWLVAYPHGVLRLISSFETHWYQDCIMCKEVKIRFTRSPGYLFPRILDGVWRTRWNKSQCRWLFVFILFINTFNQ